MKADLGGDGIARQPEEVGPAARGAGGLGGRITSLFWEAAEHHGLAGLDQGAGEKEHGAELFQHRLHQVVLARRDSTGEQHQVSAAGLGDACAQIAHRIASDGHLPGHAAFALHQRGQRIAVGVADLPGLRLLIQLDQLITRRDDGGFGPFQDVHLPTTAACGDGNFCRMQHSSGREQRIAGACLRAAPHDVFSGAEETLRINDQRLRRAAHMLQHHHGIGAFRQRRSGHDLNRLSRRERPAAPEFPGTKGANYPQLPAAFAQIGGAHSEAIPRGSVEGRLVPLGAQRPRQDTTGGL